MSRAHLSDVSWNLVESDSVGNEAPYVRGYGALMEQQHVLQSTTDEIQRTLTGIYSGGIGRLLEIQYRKIGSSISSVATFCDELPYPTRFRSWLNERSCTAGRWQALRTETLQKALTDLVAQHLKLAEGLQRLIGSTILDAPGEKILVEVARNHELMARTLTALLEGEAPVPLAIAASGRLESDDAAASAA